MRLFLMTCLALITVQAFAQQTEVVDFQSLKADLEFLNLGALSGDVSVKFAVLKDSDSVYLDAVGMTFNRLKIKNLDAAAYQDLKYKVYPDKVVFYRNFKQQGEYEVQFSYTAKPTQALYWIGDQVWTQGQGKYTSHWLPSSDDVNDKIEFDLSIIHDEGYTVLANGLLVKKEILPEGRLKWSYDMEAPMSSYLVALVIGEYEVKSEISNRGIPLEYYYYQDDSAKVDATYRYSKQMFDFLESEIGVDFPWKTYRQAPVKDFLYSGMENTTLTIFSDALVVDDIAFNDRNYVNVNAHELAHQWFGNLVTAKSSTHHWLQEGFATYYALLAEREVFGEDYYYWRLHEYAQQLLAQENAGNNTSLLDPKSSSLTFYQKGAWTLHVLREQVGDEAFRTAVRNYLEEHSFQNVETSDFISEVEKASGQELSDFVKTWLEDVALPQDAMVKSLKASAFIREYMEVSCERHPDLCNDYLVSDISDQAKIKILSHESYVVKLEDFNNSMEVRQAIAQKLTTVPLDFKQRYESLLQDASYLTKEAALYNLWVNFSQDRARYLQQTKSIVGFSDYNVKLLWLALHLNTVEYQPDQKEAIFDELNGYTDPEFGFELRMNAFHYVKLINGFDERSLGNLIQATKHHNWRFKNFAIQLLEELRSVEAYAHIIDKLTN
ncbi:M1 family metallopeptidase [Gelidibacter salicanalis]|uniref:Aminopeptidase N n=1 Tax=Gelidibacter salicanalis TaxID=291193 RepID=A0A5C7AK13_9FLAO|nr:M1 family metallopeptidase [Gelidibacter salicanalis]TXE07873.1 M1 family metallopeptidase [Gelidibacter salicanalis]